MRTVAYAIFFALADRCEAFELPFDLMIGVWRDVYPEGVHQGRDLFDNRTSLYQFRHLFNEKRRVTFPVSVLTHQQNQELVAYSWIFPNVLPCGHWWYSNIPTYIEADLRARLEAVPMNKLIGYYSDAYKLEFVLPKFNMYRRNLATVLARDFVVGKGWSEERAIELARAVLRGNGERLFGCS
jgi:glucuronate isomerase